MPAIRSRRDPTRLLAVVRGVLRPPIVDADLSLVHSAEMWPSMPQL
jgi:hypothetical protein